MQKEKPIAAVMILRVKSEEGDELLFEVRSKYVPQPLEVCFPGGHIEEGETPEQTALRECEEELGIPRGCINIEGRLSDAKRRGGERICTVVGNCDKNALKHVKLQAHEVEEVFTVPIKWLKNATFSHYTFESKQGVEVEYDIPEILCEYLKNYDHITETDYLEYDGHGIWGLTARILAVFLDRY